MAYRKHIHFFILLITLISCKNQKKETNRNEVLSYGNRQLILEENKLDGVVEIDSLFSNEPLFAIGPVEHLKGEVTIYNDLVSISSVKNDEPHVSQSKKTKAIFLLSTNENEWSEYKIGRKLSGLKDTENYIKKILISENRDISKAIPFRIETKVSKMTYHIIYKSDNLRHNKTEHQKAKIKFEMENREINIIGFWVDKDREGKLTHPGSRTHLHFIEKENKTSGHIDDIIIPVNSTIYIPKK
ncbi:acetolactate decarboxylase [Flavicella sp.]|uniref:acetolactate decarboxylase n=1 Tax=Flavicella sp. TaxID=2957742 RepID=UPI0030178427